MICAERLIANISLGVMAAVIVQLLGLNANCTKNALTKITVQNVRKGFQKGVRENDQILSFLHLLALEKSWVEKHTTEI